MEAYVPTLGDLANLGAAWLTALVLLGVGAGLGPITAEGRPEVQIILGWGAWCLLATVSLVLTPFRLILPFAALGVFGLWGLVRHTRRMQWRLLGITLLLSLPLWLVMAPIRPAEPDTWLNLLPNALYLADHGVLPVAGGPPSHSFLPAAPYNTQFLWYLGGRFDPGYAVPGMSLGNLLLLVLSGMLIARLLARDAELPPGWSRIALGLLLATLFNPGFVPRIHLAAYGETGLAVTALFAAVLFAEAAPRSIDRRRLFAIGLVLAAMVNVKQSGFGLVASVAAAGAVTCLAGPRPRLLRAVVTAGASVILAVGLFALWRWYVARAGVDELKPLPFSEWQWHNIPAILASMGRTVLQKGFYFGCAGISLAGLPVLWRRCGWTVTTRLLLFNAMLFLGYTAFLVLTYIGHFPGAWSTEAHSFFRYETHLSLVLILVLALAARDLFPALARPMPALAASMVALILLAPLGFVRYLRFDMDMPQPLVWNFAKDLAPLVSDDSRLALLLPGDNGSVATMLSGVLEDTPPRRPALDIRAFDQADRAALDAAGEAGYSLAFVSCTGADLAGVPAGHAALLALSDGVWQPRQVWAYPADDRRRRWQHILAWPTLCRDD